MKYQLKISTTICALILACLLTNCTRVALFDQTSYSNTINAKVETLALMNQAGEPFENHSDDIQNVTKLLSKAYEYDKRRTNNNITTKMWEVLAEGDESMVKRYFSLWEKQDSVSGFFITEADSLVNQGFDLLLDFESQKDKKEDQQSTVQKILTFLNQNI